MITYERYALNSLLTSRDIDFFVSLKESSFKKELHKKIFNLIKGYFDKYHKLPNKKLLLAYSKPLANEKDYNLISGLIDGFDLLDTDVSEKEVLDNIKNNEIIRFVDSKLPELVATAKDKDLDNLKVILSEIQERMVVTDKSPNDVSDRAFKMNKIKMAKPFLDSMQTHNLNFSGVVVIGGTSGGGKSILTLQQLLYSYDVEKENVCLFNFELDYDETIARMYSMITNTPFNEVYSDKDQKIKYEIEHKVNEWRSKYFKRENKFLIADETYNIVELENAIKLYAKKGFTVFAIDYLNLVELPDTRDEWKAMAKFIKRLHRLTKELGIVIITPTQVNLQDVEEKNGKIKLTTRGTRELEFSATVLLFIYQTSEEYKNKSARIFTIKARNSSKHTYIVNTEFKHMKFRDTGIVI